jgi:tripartite-type tricarboxylate transporter receptor subunit TctC
MTARRELLLGLGALAIIAFASQVARAQAWPVKAVRIIVPAAPGATSDILARGLVEPLQKALGQPIIVENRVGADGVIGTEACARAAPDGYSLCATASNSIVLNAVARAKLPYDVLRDLAPVVQAGFFDSVLVVHPSVPANTLQQLLDYAKANPDKVNWGHFGVNSTGYMYMEWLNRSKGSKFFPVPYKTQPQNMQGIVVGETGVTLGSFNHFGSLLKEGKLRALAVTTNQRVDYLPGVPTFDELGIKLPLRTWFGFHYPSATPRELIMRVNGELRKILESPIFKSNILDRISVSANTSTPEEFDRYVREQIKAVTELAAFIGIRPE